MNILIIDDDESIRSILQLLVEIHGHTPIAAPTGEDGLSLMQTNNIDFVFCDLVLPNISGREVIEFIHSRNPEIPIIAMSGSCNSNELRDMLDIGAMDFIIKPFDMELINLKIKAFTAYRQLILDKRKQTHELEQDHELAKHILKTMIERHDISGLRYRNIAATGISGDVIFTNETDSKIYTMMCDFTGHGLYAAVGSIPISQIFTTMSNNNRPITHILMEMNHKLKTSMPVGMFMMCSCLEIDKRTNKITVINHGQPACYVKNSSGTYVVESTGLPLGVVNNDQLLITPFKRHYDTLKDFEWFSATDGLTDEIPNIPFKSIMQESSNIFDKVTTMLSNHDKQVGDDVSYIHFVGAKSKPFSTKKHSFHITLTPMTLRYLNNEQMMLELFNEIVPKRLFKIKKTPVTFDIVMTELYVNAVEHGLLRLDSKIKDRQNGIEAFMQAKEFGLMRLQDGYIEIRGTTELVNDKIHIFFSIRDSGSQFLSQKEWTNNSKWGRGMMLVKGFADEIKTSPTTGCVAVKLKFDVDQ